MTITITDALQFLIENGPGRTEAQLADALFGAEGYQQRVNQDCRLLEGPGDPFTYWPRRRG